MNIDIIFKNTCKRNVTDLKIVPWLFVIVRV